MLVAVLYFVAAGLLVPSGVAKLRDPRPSTRALTATRLPSGPTVVRALGVLEIVLGVACLAAPRTETAVTLALLYGAFAVFLTALIRSGTPLVSCGCLGRRDTPASGLHLGLDLVALAAATLAAISPPPGLLEVAGQTPLFGLPFVVGMATAGYLVVVAVSHLPQAFAAYRPPRQGSPG